MAIVTFVRQEGKEQVIGFEWVTGEFKVKIVDTTTKICHRCHLKCYGYFTGNSTRYTESYGTDKGIDEVLELVEGHCAFELLNGKK
ncbi:hypothetical protein Glove_109g272 [Diversispora epigaea]|uniref:Uncharacterized protein n=1 Tax=Diversispora epigaea TaxID=1348612 RepID=A0A397J2C1_9GLOM|nr:hypothetical protein Glove_109g272 [Diversispora epigaea]